MGKYGLLTLEVWEDILEIDIPTHVHTHASLAARRRTYVQTQLVQRGYSDTRCASLHAHTHTHCAVVRETINRSLSTSELGDDLEAHDLFAVRTRKDRRRRHLAVHGHLADV